VDFVVLDAHLNGIVWKRKYFENTCQNPFFFQNLPYQFNWAQESERIWLM
jgi:hypothetical protein